MSYDINEYVISSLLVRDKCIKIEDILDILLIKLPINGLSVYPSPQEAEDDTKKIISKLKKRECIEERNGVLCLSSKCKNNLESLVSNAENLENTTGDFIRITKEILK